jgi:DNA invertase Pin-like site-specific DNA recombinase
MLLGYARTSTVDQHAGLEAQERDLRAAGAERGWSEQVSSVTHRDQLQALLGFTREADTIIVTKPDRLARSTAELLAIEADLTRRGIGLVVPFHGRHPAGHSQPHQSPNADNPWRRRWVGEEHHAGGTARRNCPGAF